MSVPTFIVQHVPYFAGRKVTTLYVRSAFVKVCHGPYNVEAQKCVEIAAL